MIDDLDHDLEYCTGCDSWVDPSMCECGSDIDNHSLTDNHDPKPMGCHCYDEESFYEEDV